VNARVLDAAAAPAARRRRLLPRLFLLAGVLAAMVCLAEVAIRRVDGYRLGSLSLQHELNAVPPETWIAHHRDLIDAFAERELAGRPDLDPAWLFEAPPPVPRQPLSPALASRFARCPEKTFLYHVNEVLLRTGWVKGKGFGPLLGMEQPDSFFVFAPVDGLPSPIYRYPPRTTLPTGLTTNAFGFRGRELSLDKPAGVVRIACVGASTTVDDHNLPHSYPEVLEFLLNRWAARRGTAVRFEVLNAAREAIRSPDIRAIVRHEVLPLAVDYVVYYEGANQFQPQDLLPFVRVAGAHELARPPDGTVPWYEAVNPDGPSLLDRCCEWSALARRWRSLSDRAGDEPPKPPQEVVLPPGFDELAPDAARVPEVLALRQITTDLAAMQADLVGAGAQLLVCSFRWFVRPGLRLDPVYGRNAFVHLNRSYWPFSYATMRRLADLQNRSLASWAKQNGVPFLDVAAHVPEDIRLYTDAIHNSLLGVRVHAMALCAQLVPLLERDLAAQRVPVADTKQDDVHPGLGPVRELTRAELDAGR
jgi:hypothetical protein